MTNSGKTKEDRSRKQSDDDGVNLRAKRTKRAGVRLVGGRIYDSEHGKTCHQCRQKTMDFVASCKNQKDDKPCTMNFCHKCLLNRYGEKAEEVSVLADWNCPKCRGICNCSFCMKKRGHQPTGILVHAAKATGFSSVSELLHVTGPENAEPAAALPAKRGKENHITGNIDSNLHPPQLPSNPAERKLKKMERKGLKEIQHSNQGNGVLLKEASPTKPQISKERLKETQGGNRSEVVLSNRTSPRKRQRGKERSTNIQESNQGDEIFLKENTTEKPLISKKEVKTGRNVKGVLEKEKNLQTRVSEGVSSNLIGCKKSKEQMESRPIKVMEVWDGQKLETDEAQPKIVMESRKVQADAMKLQSKDFDADIPLPQGTVLTTVAGIELPPEDILALKEGEPAYVLKDLIRGGRGRRGKHSPAVHFHIQLLSLIQKDLGEDFIELSPTNGKNSWVHALKNCASRSECVQKNLKLERFGQEAHNYVSLDSSERLRLLTFLCDEVLCTAQMRSWIDEQNLKVLQKVKETKERVHAVKQKDKELKQKMMDEFAKAIIAKNGAPLSISEHEAVVSQIRTEAAQAHAQILESHDMVPNDKKGSAAVRTESILLDVNGCHYWRLNGYSDDSVVLLQDVGTGDAAESGEKWFTFDVDQQKEIEKYISSLSEHFLDLLWWDHQCHKIVACTDPILASLSATLFMKSMPNCAAPSHKGSAFFHQHFVSKNSLWSQKLTDGLPPLKLTNGLPPLMLTNGLPPLKLTNGLPSRKLTKTELVLQRIHHLNSEHSRACGHEDEGTV
ncbi:hypothetical protein RHMOL_Rhmol08G0286100 [Rhododendron molle]|uniref:Uncharacterized protein n=1 Tax=Rhododendron molle TaxID=49168 RepID=A0ACC0MTQ8_RHOML|nr:hypothetical protein RHMOL_Rhmol08G0286100 [Rhododendron molle]